MKKSIYLLGLVLILFAACKKNSTDESTTYNVKYEVDNRFTDATEFVIRYTQLSTDTTTQTKTLDAYEKWDLSFEAKSGDKIYIYAKIENQSYDFYIAIYLDGGVEKFDEEDGTYSGTGHLKEEVSLAMTLE
jgi:hypothetical protein